MTREEAIEQLYDSLTRVSLCFACIREEQFKKRPALGGVFGSGGFHVASLARTHKGLHAALYMVRDDATKFVLCTGDSVSEVLENARAALSCLNLGRLRATMHKFTIDAVAVKEQAEADRRAAQAEWRQQQLAKMAAEREARGEPATPQKVKSISRRRKRIFDESDGKCHYCATTLTLDGKWHIEHKMPKALGGDDAPGNLVAACAPCNHEKRDTTDQEFIAKRARRAA